MEKQEVDYVQISVKKNEPLKIVGSCKAEVEDEETSTVVEEKREFRFYLAPYMVD